MHIIQNTKCADKWVLNTARGKYHVTYKGRVIRVTSDFFFSGYPEHQKGKMYVMHTSRDSRSQSSY